MHAYICKPYKLDVVLCNLFRETVNVNRDEIGLHHNVNGLPLGILWYLDIKDLMDLPCTYEVWELLKVKVQHTLLPSPLTFPLTR